MKLRADHVAGTAFILFGAGIIALSGDLPSGRLSMPGSGFLPKIVAGLTIFLGLLLVLRGGESPAYAELAWEDGRHALLVTAIASLAIWLYTIVGFIATMVAMIVTLLVVIERRNPVRAVAYGLGIVTLTYVCFVYGLKNPLPGYSF